MSQHPPLWIATASRGALLTGLLWCVCGQHQVNVTVECPNVFERDGDIRYIRCGVVDDPTESILPAIAAASEFISAAHARGDKVLVHCHEVRRWCMRTPQERYVGREW